MDRTLNPEYIELGTFCSCLASIPFLICLLYLNEDVMRKGHKIGWRGGQIEAGGFHVLFF